MDKDNQTPREPVGTIADAELARLKAQHGRIYQIVVDDDGDLYAAYFRRPDMAVLSAMTKMAKTDEMQAAKVMVENCFVAGAEQVRTDAALFVAAVGQLGTVVGQVRATIKNC